MNIKYFLLAAIVLMVNACASITEIAPAGKDTYVVGADTNFSSGSNLKTTLYIKANAHCEAMGKKLLPLNESTFTQSASLRFRCLEEDDPEYVRPIMESVPDVRIETN